MKKLIVLLVLFIVFICSYSQEQNTAEPGNHSKPKVHDLVTDRPDQTESSITVPKNTLQIETGFVYENFKENQLEFKNWGLGTTLLRYGIFDNLELRLGGYYQRSNLVDHSNAMDSIQKGLGPLQAGFKIFITEEKGLVPQISFLADLTFNSVGNTDYRPSYTYSSLKFLASHTITDFLSLGYNLGYANNGENADGLFVYSVVLGFEITAKFGAYAEVYGTSANGDNPHHKIDGGLTYLIAPNLQLDFSSGYGLDSDLNYYFVNFGLCWRIPR
ncbi:MAG: transporter [Bacteroidales bacterium]|nr:transporter [Bacteroidales bacterium]